MSRIGKQPIVIPEGITLEVSSSNEVTANGKLGELSLQVTEPITVRVEESVVTLERPNDQKESMKARELKRQKLVEKYAEKRAALKAAGDYEGLQKLPKNASPVRLHNRCKLTGRPKGYMRQFGISRVTFREMANFGLIPGVKKASW